MSSPGINGRRQVAGQSDSVFLYEVCPVGSR